MGTRRTFDICADQNWHKSSTVDSADIDIAYEVWSRAVGQRATVEEEGGAGLVGLEGLHYGKGGRGV